MSHPEPPIPSVNSLLIHLIRHFLGRGPTGAGTGPSGGGLAAAGLQFLFSLEDPLEEQVDLSFDQEPLDRRLEPSRSMHRANASARFIPMGGVQPRSTH